MGFILTRQVPFKSKRWREKKLDWERTVNLVGKLKPSTKDSNSCWLPGISILHIIRICNSVSSAYDWSLISCLKLPWTPQKLLTTWSQSYSHCSTSMFICCILHLPYPPQLIWSLQALPSPNSAPLALGLIPGLRLDSHPTRLHTCLIEELQSFP